ncbi:hypothetical protein SAMN05421805_10655 [Saccharopolyspora antimicrobica]|uniref:Uncharacterized protein n=1 Tax=Saccharopolyspora antimicrobica TaxID=455193 RepID=A0A1I5AZ98_9PSEU|nr:hypothetical protein [Saccharopolyspora antimicrobica]RKT86414.1 hypothetical protein ATL45_4781 [Saccharopolyspora antimicrobica]SFN67691.1 hypothetical protein SAMN05421805_10655 [Saccharopolyspora antimicrobica]
MSVFRLDKAHIDGLVNAGIQLSLIEVDEANDTGRMLLEQHYRSIGFLRDDESPPRYAVTIAPFLFHLVAILNLVACYEYQTCEGRGWGTSPAREWSRRLRDAALRRLPEAATQVTRIAGIEYLVYQTLPAWENTPWGITSLDEVPDIGDGEIVIPVIRRGLPVDILTGPSGSFSNGGLSSRVRSVVIVEIEGEPVPEFACIREPSDDAPAVSLRFEYGRYVARPADEPDRWFMASGAFLHTSDSRWSELIGHSLPIPLHDRTE